ncbi:Cof subfamily protein (haloacid dehalogenase superfamily) [Pullulanibacillus pueri]|uniref:Phosphatase n=1 Tax=Pullulanibacillus pueri TaxID=1437324 RepID=A0A8J3EM69_9BACL|nr:HAD family hydrolase [Pullulanibacillus pueri]MBM7682563.1 Cof subfamily protein (haloacid dehalogenase superfamily) [Pullulanibacillus pueri]GGH82313.1 phosphatase [Pullulanibacillus pueri]
MTNYKILFLDIDGTVIKPDDTIEDSTKEAIKQVQGQGIEVFLATGRPLHEVLHIGKELGIDSFIGYNGAYALYNNKEVFNRPMDGQVIRKFIAIAKENGHEIVLYTNGKNFVTSKKSQVVKRFAEKFHIKNYEVYTEESLDEILGLTLINIKENEVSLYAEDNFHFSQVYIEGYTDSYDVIRDNVNKGVAVQKVIDLLNISPEQAIAFGDGMNDKEMLSLVGEGFAMGNGHPDLFAYAKHKTTAVTESGIYNGLKSLGLIK